MGWNNESRLSFNINTIIAISFDGSTSMTFYVDNFSPELNVVAMLFNVTALKVRATIMEGLCFIFFPQVYKRISFKRHNTPSTKGIIEYVGLF